MPWLSQSSSWLSPAFPRLFLIEVAVALDLRPSQDSPLQQNRLGGHDICLSSPLARPGLGHCCPRGPAELYAVFGAYCLGPQVSREVINLSSSCQLPRSEEGRKEGLGADSIPSCVLVPLQHSPHSAYHLSAQGPHSL